MKSIKSRIFWYLIFNFYFLFFIFYFANAQATPSARLYFLPESGSFEVGKTFSVRLAVNTGENPINLVEANLSFSEDTLEVTGFSKTGSIVNLWFNEPSFSNTNGTISFSGGIPNPGFTGIGRLLIINFKAKATDSAWIKVSSAQVLANDGFGTNILSSSGQANFTLFKSGLPQPVEPAPKKEEGLKVKIFSSTHPDKNKWFKEKSIILSWTWQQGITDYSYLLDQKPETNPDNSGEGLSTSTAYLDVSEGIWYFHLKVKTKTGWQTLTHFKIQIDSTPPTDLKISSDQGKITFNPAPTIRFEAKDELSGIDYFTVKIFENKPIEVRENFYQLPKQKPGNVLITVRTYDKAGNYLEENFVITIEPIPIPRITYYTKEILVGETLGSLIVRGTGPEEAKIKFYLNHESGKTITSETEVKEEGKWGTAIYQLLLPGKYSGQAVAMIGEEESYPSKEIEINVKKTGVRFLFWIIPVEMIWGLIIALIFWGLGVFFILYLGAKRKFKKCDIFVRKILSKKENKDANEKKDIQNF